MGFMDDFFDKAKYVAVKAGEKTGELVEVSRLKLACVGLNTNLEKQYQKLGRIVYEMVKKEANNEEAVFQCVDEIDGLLQELREISGKLDGVKGNVCSVCGKANLEDAVFCSYCGASLTNSGDPAPEEKEPEDCGCCQEAAQPDPEPDVNPQPQSTCEQ